jgi:ketosteroid isomerase-like protein
MRTASRRSRGDRPAGACSAGRLLRLRDTARTMSQQNVELVEQGYEVLNRDGVEGVFRFLDEEIEFVPVPGWLPDAEHFHGHEGVRAWFSKIAEVITIDRWDPQEIIDAGDRLIAVVTVRGRGRATEIPAEATFYQVWTLRKRKAVRLEAYLDRRQAFRAAGLSEQETRADSS